MLKWYSILLVLCTLPLFAQTNQNTLAPILGKLDFPTSATPSAQAHFIHGVLFLHNFEYPRARAAFQKAETADPHFALAYWGEAMSYNHPLWNSQDLLRAKEALNKLDATDQGRINKARTDKEKGFIQALNLLFGKGTKKERDVKYANSMRQLYYTYPTDNEVGLFYALALLGLTEGTKNFPQYAMQAAAIAEEILQRNPHHPGALHYVIHSYDDPIHAPLGLRAARMYAQVASDAPHALHMPSHIFLGLGMWDDVIASNQAAWKASLDNHVYDVHVLQWLIYGYLQKEQYEDAYFLVKTMRNIAETTDAPLVKYYYALVRSAYLSESQNGEAQLNSLNMNGMDPISRATNIYTNALIALNKTQNPHSPDVDSYLAEMKKIASLARNHFFLQKSHDESNNSVYNTMLLTKVLELELHAHIQLRERNVDKAINTLKEATQLEDQLILEFGPPLPTKPTHEFLADVFLQNKQYIDAYYEYNNQLTRAPNRTLSRRGLEKAEEEMRKQGVAIPTKINLYFNKAMQDS